MKRRKRVLRASALLLLLTLLTVSVRTGADENGSDAPGTVYSEWVSLDDLPGSGEGADAPSETGGPGQIPAEAAPLTAEGSDYAIRVSPVNGTTLPEGAELFAAETPDVKAYEEPVLRKIGIEAKDLESLRVFDLAIMAGGVKTEPKGPVRVEIQMPAAGERIAVIHFPDASRDRNAKSGRAADASAPEEKNAGMLPVSVENGVISFETDSFSAYAVAGYRLERTVIASDGIAYLISVTYTENAGIPKGSRLLTEELTGNDPRYQTFVDESARALGCGPEDLTHSRLFDIAIVSPEGAAVEPAAPVQVRVGYAEPLLFREAQRFLVVHLAEDGTEILVPSAEGAAEGTVDSFTFEAESFSPYGIASSRDTNRSAPDKSDDLADFLNSIEIAGAEKNEEGKYVILQGVPYTVQMFFSEKTNGLQFDEDGALIYHFPDGFTPNYTDGTVEMTGDGGVVRFDYVISGDTLTVEFDKTSPGYQAFITSENARFEIHATGIISEEEIAFSTEISGEFDIDDTRRVSVQKTGAYDAALNKIKYTVQAYSRGNNSNVHIGDIITGTALTYDPASLTVSSDVSNPVQYVPDTREGETFGLTIPSMAHGETVTIEYYADVNLNGVSHIETGGFGTAEETGNTVRIHSDFDTPGQEITVSGKDFENRISLSSNSKTASSQTVRDEKTYVTWTIVLNEYANISIAGKSVTDIIDEASRQYMRYSGYGIHIEKYQKDGTPAGTEDIRWGTNGLSAGYGESTWTYTIPDTDGEYKYVITYETEVDSEAFLQTTNVSNTVHNDYDDDQGTAAVDTTGEEVEAAKSAVHSAVDETNKTAETEWEITFTVPAAGLDSAVITDDLPGLLDPATMTWFYDALKSNSVRVKDGDLLADEGFTVDSTSQEHRVVITFTKNNGQPGLNGTGLTRTIHVYLTTTASHDWLVYAESQSRARTHLNNAVVRVNGQDIRVSATASYNTSQYDLEKVLKGVYYTSTDPALPIYTYRIILTNVNEDAFDQDGFITITDRYDSDYLVFYPEFETNDNFNVNGPNGYVYGNNQWNKYELLTKGGYVVDSYSEGQIIFKISRDDLPMAGTSYYPYYAVAYALQIRDAETLAGLKLDALHSDGLKVGLENSAGSDQFGTNTIVTDYSVEALNKQLLGEEDNSATGTHDLHFSIAVNAEALKIGDGDTITLKDTVSNLSFDYTSIVIEPQLEGDILNRVGNSIIFTLHNETAYTITYTARLIGISGVHWNNKAELYGRISDVDGTSSSQSGGSGSYSVYSMNVKKYAEGNMNKGLEAAFELYEARVKDANGNDIPNPEWKKVGEFTTDGTTGIYKISTVVREGAAEEQSLRLYSFHDSDGIERFGADDPEAYGWRYRIKETAAPEGYRKLNEMYEFGISDIPSYNGPVFNYLNGDTVTIVNKPTPGPADAVVSGTKVLIGKELEDQEFTFTLRPEAAVEAAWGGDYPGGFDGSLTVKNDEAGGFSFRLSFTYDDYLAAEQKGFVGADQCANFYYVVREEIPYAAEDGVWNGVRYDSSQFLVRIRLIPDGNQLRTEKRYYPYDGNWIPEQFL